MNNRLKFKLIRTFPIFFKKEVRELSMEYNSETAIEKKLIDIIKDVTNDKFLITLKNEYGVHFIIDEFTPKELLDNKVFVDFVIKNRPKCVEKLPNSMITDEYLNIYINYIKNNEDTFYLNDSLPERILESDYILNLAINKINSSHQTVSSIIYFINYISKDNQKLNYALDNIEQQLISTFWGSEFKYFNDDARSNEKLIKIFLDKDCANINIVSGDKYKFAKEYIISEIRKGEFNYNFTNDDIYSTENNKVFQDRDFFDEIVKNEIIKYLSNKVRNDYEEKLLNKINNNKKVAYDSEIIDNINISNNTIRFLKALDLSTNIQDLDINHKLLLFHFLTKTNIDSKIVEELKNDNELLNIMINKGDFRCIQYFNVNIITNDNLTAIVDNIDKIESYPFVEKLVIKNNDNQSFLNMILYKALENEEIYKIFSEYFLNFEPKLYNASNANIIIDLLEKYEYNEDKLRSISTLENCIRYSSLLLNRMIDLGKLNNIDIFFKYAFDKEAIDKLKYKISFKKLRNYVENDNLIEKSINIKGKSEIEEMFYKACEQGNLILLLLVVQKYYQGGYKDEFLEKEMQEEISSRIEVSGIKEKLSIDQINLLISKIARGERSPFNVEYLINDKCTYYILNIGNIESVSCSEYISALPMELLQKINKKQFLQVIKLLEEHNITANSKVMLAFNMYLTIGLSRTRDLLNMQEGKNYGNIDEAKLLIIFRKVTPQYCTLKKEGNGYEPELNEELINIIFGANYKIKNTPIRNYLNGCKDKNEQIDTLIDRIKNDLSLSLAEKEEKISSLEKQARKYSSDLFEFVDNISACFNEWDIVEEEFLKIRNKSKLKVKLNLSEINKIIKLVESKRRKPDLDLRDEPLLHTDVFDFVGYDNQFTFNPAKAPDRAIELSRMMEGVFTKKFPNISVERNGCKLEILNPQDRGLLSMGYKSRCCFRPNGNADNDGKNNSLLTYCCKEEYGGGLKICDESGKVLMFSPVLRNGNVLMIHSIETNGMTDNEKRIVHELLVEYANENINKSSENDDEILFVVITDLHNLDERYVEGQFLEDYKFKVYDPNGDYDSMYNNLSSNHMILAKKEGAKFEDIRYDSDMKSYDYPKPDYKGNVYVSEENKDIINTIDEINTEIIKLSNERKSALEIGDSDKAYTLNKLIKDKKQQYLYNYSKLLKSNNGKDVYADYKKAERVVKSIANLKSKEIPQDIKECIYGIDWYIAVTYSGAIRGDYLEQGKQEYLKQLNFLNSVLNNKDLSDDGIKKL